MRRITRLHLLVLALISLGFFPPQVKGQGCPLEVWAYDSHTTCTSYGPPLARGLIQTDGTCRETDILEDDSGVGMAYLPGIYAATCAPINDINSGDEYQVIFSQSGCSSDDCAPPPSDLDSGFCERDWSVWSVLYSLVLPPNRIPVTDPEFLAMGGRRCLGLVVDGSIVLTIAVYGNCNCETSAPSPSPVTISAPTAAPSMQSLATANPTVAPSVRTTTLFSPTWIPTSQTPPNPTSSPDVSEATSKPSLRTLAPTMSGSKSVNVVNEIITLSPSATDLASKTMAPNDLDEDSRAALSTGDGSGLNKTSIFAASVAAGLTALLCCGIAYCLLLSKEQQQRKGTERSEPKISSSTPPEVFFVSQENEDVSTIGDPAGFVSRVDAPYEDVTVQPERPFAHNGEEESIDSGIYTSGTDIRISKDDGSLDDFFAGSNASRITLPRETFEVTVPPGPLGILIDSRDGRLRVSALKTGSVFLSKGINVGDCLVTVDQVDVRRSTPLEVSAIVTERASKSRIFRFERASNSYHSFPEADNMNFRIIGKSTE